MIRIILAVSLASMVPQVTYAETEMYVTRTYGDTTVTKSSRGTLTTTVRTDGLGGRTIIENWEPASRGYNPMGHGDGYNPMGR
jgi:hypothetical protein